MVKAQAAAASASAPASAPNQEGVGVDTTSGGVDRTQSDQNGAAAQAAADTSHQLAAGMVTPAAVTHEEIQTMAYKLWVDRGCPEGTAERDWLEAEEACRERLRYSS